MLRIFNACVAVATFNAHGADVVGVAKGYGLFTRCALPRGITRVGNEFDNNPRQCTQNNDSKNDARAGKRVRAGFEDLWHAVYSRAPVAGHDWLVKTSVIMKRSETEPVTGIGFGRYPTKTYYVPSLRVAD